MRPDDRFVRCRSHHDGRPPFVAGSEVPAPGDEVLRRRGAQWRNGRRPSPATVRWRVRGPACRRDRGAPRLERRDHRLVVSRGHSPATAAGRRAGRCHLGLLGRRRTRCRVVPGVVARGRAAHSIVAKRHGVEVRDITLWMLGGMSSLESEPRDASTELRVALAGPATSAAVALGSLVVAVVASGLRRRPRGRRGVGLARHDQRHPRRVQPRARGAARRWPHPHRDAVAPAGRPRQRHPQRRTRAGRVFGYVLIALGLLEFAAGALVGGVWLAFVGWFVLSVAHAEEHTAHARLGSTPRPAGRVAPPPLPTAPPSRHGPLGR